MSRDGRWGHNHTKGGGGVKQNMAVAVAATRVLASADVRRCSGEGFTVQNKSKSRWDKGVCYPGRLVARIDV
jgi:hypothetical protein